MKTILFILFLMPPILLNAQNDTTFLFGLNGKMVESDAVIKKEIKYINQKKTVIQIYQLAGQQWLNAGSEVIRKTDADTYRVKPKHKIFGRPLIRKLEPGKEGKFKFTESLKGQLIREGTSTHRMLMIPDGEITEYYSGGNTKSVSLYRNNELISNENWLKDGSKYIDNIFYSVESYPQYTGGQEELNRHIMEVYRNNNVDFSSISGAMEIGFVVMEDGTLSGVRILKGFGTFLNDITVDAFQTLEEKWEPARLQGEKVRFFQVFPINFIYNDVKFDFINFKSGVMNYESF